MAAPITAVQITAETITTVPAQRAARFLRRTPPQPRITAEIQITATITTVAITAVIITTRPHLRLLPHPHLRPIQQSPQPQSLLQTHPRLKKKKLLSSANTKPLLTLQIPLKQALQKRVTDRLKKTASFQSVLSHSLKESSPTISFPRIHPKRLRLPRAAI